MSSFLSFFSFFLLTGFCTTQFFPPDRVKVFIPGVAKKCVGIKAKILKAEKKGKLITITKKLCGENTVRIKLPEKYEGTFIFEVYEMKGEKGVKRLCRGKVKLPDKVLRFAVIGDTSYKTGYLPYIVEEIKKFSPNFVFHTGDLQYETVFDKWEKLLGYLSPLFQNSFFYISAGNHEYEGEEDERTFMSYFPHEGTFIFRWQNMVFAGLNMFMSQERITRFFHKLKDMGRNKLREPTKLLIFFLHKPFIRITISEKIRLYHRGILKQLLSLGFDKIVVFSGHDHAYGRIELSPRIKHIISGGGGAYLYGCSLKEKIRRISDMGLDDRELVELLSRYGVDDIEVKVCKSEFHTVLCEVSGEAISCRAKSPVKGEIDQFRIDILE